MTEYKFTIPGQPVAWEREGRRIVTSRSGKTFIAHYTKKKTAEAQAMVRACSMSIRPAKPLEGPLLLGIRCYRRVLKGWSKKKLDMAIRGAVRPDTKPDMDNYIKLIKDALNGNLWKDDAQVVEYLPGIGKYYALEPRTEVTIKPFIFTDEVQSNLF